MITYVEELVAIVVVTSAVLSGVAVGVGLLIGYLHDHKGDI